jgi:N-acetylglucosamine kinase-like BadF-type ATPase
MPSILLVESGSTKTDWCLLKKGGKPLHLKTSGINPRLQSPEEIKAVLQKELKGGFGKHTIDSIVYYGAGTGNIIKQKELTGTLRSFFNVKKVDVNTDLLGAARALCGDKKGIISILGTGSHSCVYNGSKITEQQISLGFIAGDEGSGNYIGKRILQYYAYKTFDAELMLSFEQLFGNDVTAIIHDLYSQPFPNRQLANFVKLAVQCRGHYMVENILEDCINDFFHHHILKYRQSWKIPLYFTGSVAYEFRDIIADLCGQYELDLGTIHKSPMDGLIAYHKKHL